MIKFFRNIRKKLISENQMGKYFKYAIGEILLVMIGILLALQVNNWNENRKLHQEGINLLKELRKDVVFAIEELDTVAFYNNKNAEYLKEIQKYLYSDLPYNTVLDTAFGELDLFHIPYLPVTAYETLKVRGLDRIQNDSLKVMITGFFDFGYQRINDMADWEWSFNQNTTQRMMIGNIRRATDINDTGAYPNDYNALKENEEFGNFLNVLVILRLDHVGQLTRLKGHAVELLKVLDKELSSENHD